ncbi:MAG: glycosyltransferase family 2 protein [Betaproteobacteria bacterium]
MKLVIQIPCRDEELDLPRTVADLPSKVAGIDEIALVVIDDGSKDRTSLVAGGLGAHVRRLSIPRGLAHAFAIGLETSLACDADIIVNTDGDNQYCGEDIALLVVPILAGEADIVVGARPIANMPHFSPLKRTLQRLGSWTVRRLSGTQVADATSGFRAMSRDAALQLNVFSGYTYTLETIVQAAHRGLRIVSVPVRVNATVRQSRLVRGNFDYVWRTGSELLRVLVVYSPFRSFMLPALGLLAVALAIGVRFLFYFASGDGTAGHIQSLILAAILFGASGIFMAVAFVGDLIAINRRLLEDLQLEARRARLMAARRHQGNDRA